MGVKSQRRLVRRFSVRIATEKCEGVPEVDVGVHGSWIQGERALERADGLLRLLEFQICQAEVVVRIAACRVDGDGVLIRCDRFSVALLGAEVTSW